MQLPTPAIKQFPTSQVAMFLHWQAGRSIQAISRSLGMDRKAVRTSGWQKRRGSIKASRRFVRDRCGVEDPRLRSRWFAELDGHRQFIREALEGGNTLSTIHRRLLERTGLGVSVAACRRYVRETMPDVRLPEPVTVGRPEVQPGEEAQVDWLWGVANPRRGIGNFL